MTVAADYAAYLKATGLVASVSTATAEFWPDGVTIQRTSPMATADGGVGEAARQAAFFGGSKVRDIAVVPGRRSDLLGRAIVARNANLGYDRGRVVFVVGAEEKADGTTALTVVGKL